MRVAVRRRSPPAGSVDWVGGTKAVQDTIPETLFVAVGRGHRRLPAGHRSAGVARRGRSRLRRPAYAGAARGIIGLGPDGGRPGPRAPWPGGPPRLSRSDFAMHPLIDAPTLQAHLDDPRWMVVDTRHDLAKPTHGQDAYAQAHIPGALFLHLDTDLSGPQRDAQGRFHGRHPLPDRAGFARRLATLGVGPDTVLVAYDEADGMFAARLWWLALWVGHASVAVLDGGFKAWRTAGYPVSAEQPPPRQAVPLEVRAPLVRTMDAGTLAADLGKGHWRVVDARAAERYRGDIEPLDAKAGHIPGAVNRPFRANVETEGRFRPAAELEHEFAALLQDVPAENVVHQCGSGVTACHNLLAMTVAGRPGSLLYPGSWSEWSADPQRPVATGPAP